MSSFQSVLLGSCALILCCSRLAAQCFTCAHAPAGTIWCDDFEDTLALTSKYFEYDANGGDFIALPGVGRDNSRGMRVRWQMGEVSAGNLKKSFGRVPGNYIKRNSAFPDSSFTEIYWRMDIRHQDGWSGGGPAKLSRALVLANDNWAEGMMAHLWSGGNNGYFLVMDPASGIDAQGNLVSTKYNDFDHLRWLGMKPGNIPLFRDDHIGRWYCVEGHVRLNTPGSSDGVFEFWINDTLQAGSYTLNWHGGWNSDPAHYTINAVFFENYWNDGSPVQQDRYFDNIVIATQRIGCACESPTGVRESGSDGTRNTLRVRADEATLFVTLTGNLRGQPLLARIFDIVGRECVSTRTSGNDEIQIPIQSLHRGVYGLVLTGENGRTTTTIFARGERGIFSLIH